MIQNRTPISGRIQDVDAPEVPVRFVAIKTIPDKEPVFDLKAAIIELNMSLSSDRFVYKSSYFERSWRSCF